ncbi:MAG: amidohydrolase [Actinomycetes bacterium]|jgi:predicted TIM-barrel fold metal-dependent hydrolase|nr:amidohydrolase [Actinomycetes bacterium]
MPEIYDGPMYDLQCHAVWPDYLEEVRNNFFTEDGFPMVTDWTPEKHLDYMDRAGIQWSLLTLASPHPHYHNDQRCAEICRSFNEQSAELKRKLPDRFGWAATLPHPNVDLAMEEALYALDELDATTIKVATNSRGLYMGDPTLDPLFELASERGLTVIMHPAKPWPVNERVFSAWIVPLYEFLADSTRAVLNMIFNGVFSRYPNFKLVVPHNGSFLPNIYSRIGMIAGMLARRGIEIEVDVDAIFERLYFDNAGNANPNSDILLHCAPADHLMYASDYPFTPEPVATALCKEMKEYYAAHPVIGPVQEEIFAGNARKLFGVK